MSAREVSVRCCIAGGGPAGMMLGLLLARAGVAVLVLEKHADFLRDFRGDTIHPSTLEIMYELGLLEEFLQRPHQEVRTSRRTDRRCISPGRRFWASADPLPVRRFDAAMGFPELHRRAGQALSGFPARNGSRGDRSDRRGRTRDRGAGRDPGGGLDRSRGSVIGADGRHSIVRAKAGLEIVDLGAPMDVLWMRLSRRPTDPGQTLGRVDAGRILVMLNREDYWQCALRDPERRVRSNSAGRPGGLSRGDRAPRPISARSRRRARRLVRHQVVDRFGRSLAGLASVRPVVHRRCGSRHVADRRRRHQSGDTGRRRRGQYPGPPLSSRSGYR